MKQNLEWRDETSYSRAEKERIPRVWICNFGKTLKVVIHKHISTGDEWNLTCGELGINLRGLNTTDLEDAKRLGVDLIKTRLKDLVGGFEEIIGDIEEVYPGNRETECHD